MVRRDRSNRDYHAFIRCRYNVSPALICGFEPLRNSTQFPPLQVTDGTRGLQLEGTPAAPHECPSRAAPPPPTPGSRTVRSPPIAVSASTVTTGFSQPA